MAEVQVVDTRLVGKPERYNGKNVEEWGDWKWTLLNWVGPRNPTYQDN